MTPPSGRPRDGGYLALEWVLVVPFVFIAIAFVFVLGQVSNAKGELEASTRDAARLASEAYTYAQADAAAQQAVQDAAGNSCTSVPDVQLTFQDTDMNEVDGPAGFQPGYYVTATASCTYSASAVLGPLGDTTISSSFSSIIDPNKSIG